MKDSTYGRCRMPWAVAVVTAVAFSASAEAAQRACSAMSAPRNALPTTAATRSVSPQVLAAKAPVVVVSGGGRALLADASGSEFAHQFSISAAVYNDGAARGQATFVFPRKFSQVWGAVPGVDLMLLNGEILSAEVGGDGEVTLTGPFIETDFSRSEGVVFQENSRVTGVGPLRVEVTPGSETFKFTWCELTAFNEGELFTVTVTNGSLDVR